MDGWREKPFTAEVARFLGISPSHTLKLIRTGRIKARYDRTHRPHGRWVYSRRSVEEYKKFRDANPLTAPGTQYLRGAMAHEGVVAAKAFELFDQGKSLSEVTRLLCVKPERIRRLWQEYKTPLGQRVMTPEAEAELFERQKILKELELKEEAIRASVLRASKPSTIVVNGKSNGRKRT